MCSGLLELTYERCKAHELKLDGIFRDLRKSFVLFVTSAVNGRGSKESWL